MADNDLQINVRTTADLTGLQQLRSEVSGINADIAAQLAAAGARFDPITNSFKTITTESQAAASAWSLTGASMGKATGEATVLAREIATGNVQARTLGALLGALGPAITLAAIAGIGLFKIFEQIAESIMKGSKEMEKFEAGFGRAQEKLLFMAKTARDLGDEVKLADAIQRELDRSAAYMAKFRADQIPKWEEFANTIAHLTGTTRSPFEERAGRDFADAIKASQQATRDLNVDLDIAKQKIIDWDYYQNHIVEGVVVYSQKVADLTGKLDQLDVQRHAAPADASLVKSYDKVLTDLDDAKSKLQQLQKEQEQLNRLAEKENRKDFNAELRETAIILQGIREQQQLIQGAPFMGADEKSAALLAKEVTEYQALKKAIEDLNATRSSLTDPVEIERANQEMQKLVFSAQQLGQKIAAAVHPLQAELQTWANSFGSTMQQVGKTIEQTVGAALQGLNQWIVTGKFNLQSMIQQIEMLGLQVIEQLIIQRLVAAVNAHLAVTQAITESKIIAAAWGPAATAVTVATEGEAASSAPGAFAIALGAIQGMLGVGTAHEGGPIRRKRMHSGGLAADEVPIIAQEGEIMIQKSIAQQPGMAELLLGINDGLLFHIGGRVRRMHRGGGEFGGIVASGGDPPGQGIGPIDIPPADMGDPFGGSPDNSLRDLLGPDWADSGADPAVGRYWNDLGFGSPFASLTNPGYFGPVGSNWFNQGPTMIPTLLGNSGYPMAVALEGPLGGDYPTAAMHHATGGHYSPHHSGGLISRLHSGGSISGLPRFHSGGSISSSVRGAAVHIHNYTDLKLLVKELAGREGRKIIVDTVRGNRIDLGI